MVQREYSKDSYRHSVQKLSKVHNKSSISPKVNRATKYRAIPVNAHSYEQTATIPKGNEADVRVKSSSLSNFEATYDDTAASRGVSTSQLISAIAGVWSLVGQIETVNVRKSNDIHCNENLKCYSVDNAPCIPVSDFSENEDSTKYGECLSGTRSIYKDLCMLKMGLLYTSRMTAVHNVSPQHVQDILTNLNVFHACKYKWFKVSGPVKSLLGSSDAKLNCHYGKTVGACGFGKVVGNSSIGISNCNKSPLVVNSQIRHENVKLCQTNSICQLQPRTGTLGSSISSVQQYSIPISDYSSPKIVNDCISDINGEVDVTHTNNKQVESDNNNKRVGSQKYDYVENKSCEFQLSPNDRVCNAISMNRHALAGALAGTVVSVCLHPVDTVKTIIQANRTGRNSFFNLLKHTIEARGVLGLYRGLASKIASSAPISAIYTFTYESVKGTLLPVFPKKCKSLAHCVAGGCSSIATSVVFTPSECIKQHMQVSSQYRNCWDAFVGCIEKGGLASLYSGWSAVLCRNIPHSIIKFYTYETLKQFLMAAPTDNSKNKSWHILACGGIAGSTAALFTTPFDVVKTRIQTQVHDTGGGYRGVCHALQEIAKKEGLHGLFRGLVPRLAMYISQGAIFFASYEFLKSVLNLDTENIP